VAPARPPVLTPALGVVLSGPAASIGATARSFEAAGVDSLWTGEYFQSGPVRAAVIGAATERVAVGTHVLQAFARSPLATALAATELQELTGGRAVVGLGSQVPAANHRWHGASVPRPLAAFDDYVRAVRLLLATPGDERCVHRGPQVAFDVPPLRHRTTQAPPPLWVGGAGPGTVGVAAGVAHGLHGHLLWTPAHVASVVRPRLAAEGAPDMPVTVARMAAPATVPGGRIDLARRLAHYMVTPAYQPLLDAQGLAIDREALRDAVVTGDDARIVPAVEPHLDRFCVTHPAELAEQLEAATRHGVAGVILVAPADPARPEATAAYESELLDLVTEARAVIRRGGAG
jgi:alkanesulfonate monooxygenase SsuD/methylene tetrahydromethanopterin reductase-like flavin-dependent oxidoreductase (luciferase family)